MRRRGRLWWTRERLRVDDGTSVGRARGAARIGVQFDPRAVRLVSIHSCDGIESALR